MLFMLIEHDGHSLLVPDEIADKAVVALGGVLHLAGVAVDRECRLERGERQRFGFGEIRHQMKVAAMNGSRAGHEWHPTKGV